jgi:murein DD-endopeptidase MepM/ murein hydrolase activator NlpD
VTVRRGDRVQAGQQVGECGNSGNTSEPHLHIHLMDDWEDGLPLYFYGYRSGGTLVERGMPKGGIEVVGDDFRLAGETIQHVGLPDVTQHQSRSAVVFHNGRGMSVASFRMTFR